MYASAFVCMYIVETHMQRLIKFCIFKFIEKNVHENNDMVTEQHESDKQTETILDNLRSEQINGDEFENIYANTQIYSNTNVLGTGDYANVNCTIPFGKKPALPPKPSSQANTMKRNRSTTTTTGMTTPLTTGQKAILHLNSEYSTQKDPAEMSLKERLALFEQSTQTIKPIATASKIQTQLAPMTLPKKQSQQNSVRTPTENAAIIHSTLSNEISKSK